MIYIQTDIDGKIIYENYDPTTLSSEILAKGYTIDSMPSIEGKVGFSVEKIYNATTGVVTINYVAIPLTTDQTIANLQAQVASLLPNSQPVANPIAVSDYQKNKIAQINDFYNQTIYNTFTSTAFDGSTQETYACDATSQVRVNGEVTMAMAVKAGFSTELLSWKNVTQAKCVSWTADQIIKLGTDLHSFITKQTDYLEALTAYINSLTTVDAVNKVTWGMTIPS